MSELTDKYSKNFSPERKKEFEKHFNLHAQMFGIVFTRMFVVLKARTNSCDTWQHFQFTASQ